MSIHDNSAMRIGRKSIGLQNLWRAMGLGSLLTPNTALGIFAVSGYANLTRAYSLKPAVKGGKGVRTFSLTGTLPAGMSFNSATGEITGTPTGTGTTSGLAIRCTDGSGTALSNTFSIVVGAAPTVITASGDTTGATDITAINAALAGGNSIVLNGTYRINATIRQPGNTAIYADAGTVFLVNASNCQMWLNTNPLAQTRTDQNMAIVGSDNFYFNGNADNQVLQTNARNNQGFTAISVINLKITGIKVQSRTGAFFMIGSQYCQMHTIELAQSTSAVNSDGLDVGGGSSFIVAESWTGYVKDDCFSFFAKNKQSATMMAAGTPWEAGADVNTIYLTTVSVDCGLNNMFRLQAGNGFKLTGVYGTNIANVVNSGVNRFLIQTGELGYLDSSVNAPVWTDISDIVMDGVTGFANWLSMDTSCSNIRLYNIVQNKNLQKAVSSNIGGNPTVYNVTIDGVTDTSPGVHATLIDVTLAYWNTVAFKNIALTSVTSFISSAKSLQNMIFTNIALVSGAPTLSSTPLSAGTFTAVTVAGVPLVTTGAFQSLLSGIFTDNFNRADENVNANAAWLLISGVATGVQIASNVIKANDTAGAGSAVAAGDMGSPDHYVQAMNNLSAGAGSSFLVARLMDYNNWVGVRYNPTSTQFEVYQRLGSTLTSLGSYVYAGGAGKIMRLEVVGNTAALKVEGVTVLSGLVFSPKILSSRAGINARSTVVANLLDNFECGKM